MGKIQNFDSMATNPERKAALEIAESGLLAIDTKESIRDRVTLEGGKLTIKDFSCSLETFSRVFVIAIGKCALEASKALIDVLGDKLHGGIAFDVYKPENCDLKNMECFAGTHPLPSEINVDVTKKLVSLLSGLSENDLVLFVISGGGSTLLCLPEEGANCLDEGLIVKDLMGKGATIQEINTIRKHLSLARGGNLAKYAYPAHVVSLIFSDVLENDIEFIASGPTFKDSTTIADADEILFKYNILQSCGLDHCGLIETPKEDMYFEKVTNILFMSSEVALEAMQKKAEELGFTTTVKTSKLKGEAKDVGLSIASDVSEVQPNSVLLYAGETTVTVKNGGKGGRNQELILSALTGIKAGVVVSINSDGKDNSDHAGAIGDPQTVKRSQELGLNISDFLVKHSSYDFFEQVGDFIQTGLTGSNVSDFVIALRGNDR